ncbi:hypothetical protein HCMG_00788 [Helicobacter canadensis MIT 98-5491]|nr:hypothetical protein HCMG_00788 [Helicobacter canadensis MIT 98-5491]
MICRIREKQEDTDEKSFNYCDYFRHCGVSFRSYFCWLIHQSYHFWYSNYSSNIYLFQICKKIRFPSKDS